MSLLLAIVFGVAGALGAFTLHAVGHGGRVEIAPAALAHARTAVRPKTHSLPKPPAATTATASTLVAQRAWLGGSHDPTALAARARQMRTMGLDVTLIDVPLAKPFSLWHESSAEFWPAQSLPVYGYGHHADGIEIRGIPERSPLRVAGLAEGDQLLGIDGYRFDDDSFRNVDVAAIEKRASVVVELTRAEHHVVLMIHWPAR